MHYAGEVTYNVTGEDPEVGAQWGQGKGFSLSCLSSLLSAGFLDKNNDLLFRNLKEVRRTWEDEVLGSTSMYTSLPRGLTPAFCSQTMCSSKNPIMSQCFDRSELSDKKRPETVQRVWDLVGHGTDIGAAAVWARDLVV